MQLDGLRFIFPQRLVSYNGWSFGRNRLLLQQLVVVVHCVSAHAVDHVFPDVINDSACQEAFGGLSSGAAKKLCKRRHGVGTEQSFGLYMRKLIGQIM